MEFSQFLIFVLFGAEKWPQSKSGQISVKYSDIFELYELNLMTRRNILSVSCKTQRVLIEIVWISERHTHATILPVWSSHHVLVICYKF